MRTMKSLYNLNAFSPVALALLFGIGCVPPDSEQLTVDEQTEVAQSIDAARRRIIAINEFLSIAPPLWSSDNSELMSDLVMTPSQLTELLETERIISQNRETIQQLHPNWHPNAAAYAANTRTLSTEDDYIVFAKDPGESIDFPPEELIHEYLHFIYGGHRGELRRILFDYTPEQVLLAIENKDGPYLGLTLGFAFKWFAPPLMTYEQKIQKLLDQGYFDTYEEAESVVYDRFSTYLSISYEDQVEEFLETRMGVRITDTHEFFDEFGIDAATMREFLLSSEVIRSQYEESIRHWQNELNRMRYGEVRSLAFSL